MATRLEDVAAAVGLKRAALFYHFKDKQSLYEAAVADAFASLAARLDEAFSAPSSISMRLERAVEVWVETIVARPTLAHLILRHAAEAEEHAMKGMMFPGVEKLLHTGLSLFEQGRASGELRPVHDNPFHVASAAIGTTVFYVAALARLLPNTEFSPTAPEQVAVHKRDAVKTLRLLLGIRARRRGRAKRR